MSEVIWWPVLGQNKKTMLFLNSYDPGNLCFSKHHAKWVNWKFWPLIRGHLMTSTRSKWKNNVIFGFLGPWNLYFNIQHSKSVNSKLWPLIRGQKSLSDLWGQNEKIMPFFGFLSPKNLYFNIHHAKLVNSKFWPLIRGQRSFGDLYEVKMKK